MAIGGQRVSPSKYDRQRPLPDSSPRIEDVGELQKSDTPVFVYPEDGRQDGTRDRDRVLYCSAFRRLSGVTQVVSPSGRHPTHNRLTHTLEVAQIAKSIAIRLLSFPQLGYDRSAQENLLDQFGGLDPDVVEAAALAHDLGHPPFGHVAEETLDRLVSFEGKSRDGFEGNAQSFRILTVLSVKNSNVPGLNLTRGTLSAVSKYPWVRFQHESKIDKWGAYQEEEGTLDWSREHLPPQLRRPRGGSKIRGDIRTLEAQIMDWADDVAYAIHDLEDFYRVGVIPLHRLKSDSDERGKVLQSHFDKREITSAADKAKACDTLDAVFELGTFNQPYEGTREHRAAVREFTSSMVGECIKKVKVEFHEELGPRLILPTAESRMVTMLKDILWHYVIDGRALSAQRLGQTRIVETLFDALCVVGSERTVIENNRPTDKPSIRFKEAMHLFPIFNRELIVEASVTDVIIARSAADVIASLTESQAIDFYRRITGHALGSALDPII